MRYVPFLHTMLNSDRAVSSSKRTATVVESLSTAMDVGVTRCAFHSGRHWSVVHRRPDIQLGQGIEKRVRMLKARGAVDNDYVTRGRSPAARIIIERDLYVLLYLTQAHL